MHDATCLASRFDVHRGGVTLELKPGKVGTAHSVPGDAVELSDASL
jgi:hypothetical protein